MGQRVIWHPGGWRNRPFEIAAGEREGGYTFSLCHRQDKDDPFAFHLWAYNKRGYHFHIGGFATIREAAAAAVQWEDPESQKIPTVNL